MIEINLVPDVKQELIRAQRARAAVVSGAIITSIVAVSIMVLLIVYIISFQNIRHSNLDKDIVTKSGELAQVEDLPEMLTIQNQLSKIGDLNNSKKMNSRVFDMLEAVLPPAPNSVRISQVAVDNDKSTITLEGQTGAFDSMEVFKKTLESAVINYLEDGEGREVKLVTNLDIGEATFGSNANNEKVVVFMVTFEYPLELFSPTIPAISIKLNAGGNVTDSYLGIPRSIFTEPATEIEE